ncbi:MAG: hypothetical protein KDC26_05790 [Armatimonadetes bacterium]|nr:hypothetical protein [Armatimonadota bacterium]
MSARKKKRLFWVLGIVGFLLISATWFYNKFIRTDYGVTGEKIAGERWVPLLADPWTTAKLITSGERIGSVEIVYWKDGELRTLVDKPEQFQSRFGGMHWLEPANFLKPNYDFEVKHAERLDDFSVLRGDTRGIGLHAASLTLSYPDELQFYFDEYPKPFINKFGEVGKLEWELDLVNGENTITTTWKEVVIRDEILGLKTGYRLDFRTLSNSASQRFHKPELAVKGRQMDQHAIEAMAIALQSHYAPGTPPSPFANTNTRYSGHVFWDADMWLYPCLIFLDPDYAPDIPKYRLDRLKAAEENYDKWANDDYPIAMPGNPQGKKSLRVDPVLLRLNPAKYPWESKFDGTEGSPSETVFEEHISGDVAFMLDRAIAFGQVDQEQAEQAIMQVATYYQMRSSSRDDGRIGLDGVVSPSEWDIVNDDLYTNAIAAWTMSRASKHFQAKPFLPRDETTFLTFPGDKLKQYQQHAALLTVFPLQLPVAEAEAEEMLKRFQGKTYPKGPAMSLSIEATILARLGRADEALMVWRESWLRYGHPNLYQFREKPDGESYFMTGAAGCLNTVLYGFMGLRIDDYEPQDKAWKMPLKNGHWLSVEPHLPSEWDEITLKDVKILGKHYNFTATHKGFTADQV